MKIIILGANGMLGRYIEIYFKRYIWPDPDIDIIGLTRLNIDASKITAIGLHDWLNLFHHLKTGDVVINCIGAIKPRVDELGTYNAIMVNSAFPHILFDVVNKLQANLIHITTDCVYSGNRLNESGVFPAFAKRGNYSENDLHDAQDIYGRTKSLGEPQLATVIRTSIIGEEPGRKQRSLLQWVLDNEYKSINGYDNHYWNGVTCLRLAQVIGDIILQNEYWLGVKHIFSNIVSKYELVKFINEVYVRSNTVVKTRTVNVDRTLRTGVKDVIFPEFDIYEDIKEQKEFKL
jgi:dTDP-4-dehydrorhamnose reductase